MRAAFIQMKICFGEKSANLAHIAELVEHNPADLLVLPELCTSGYLFASREQAAEMAEAIPNGPACEELSALARRKNCFLVAGIAEKADSKIFNSAVLLGPRGHLATYRKIHLFDEEKTWFDPGDRPFSVQDIGPAKVGMMICFDSVVSG